MHNNIVADLGTWQGPAQARPFAANSDCTPREIFRARCEARALLYRTCEIGFHDTIDELQDWAEASGLVAEIGQDGVQESIARAFTEGSDAVAKRVVQQIGEEEARKVIAAASASMCQPTSHERALQSWYSPGLRESAIVHRGPGYMSDEYEGLSPSFAALCRAADGKVRSRQRDPRLERLRRLTEDNVSFERAWDEINPIKSRAAASTVEALMLGLREGFTALTDPVRQRRLSELNDEQLREVCNRLQKHRPERAPAWTPEEVMALIDLWSRLHAA